MTLGGYTALGSADELHLHGNVIFFVKDKGDPLPGTPYGETLVDHSQVKLVSSVKELEESINDDLCALVFSAEVLNAGAVDRALMRSWFEAGLTIASVDTPLYELNRYFSPEIDEWPAIFRTYGLSFDVAFDADGPPLSLFSGDLWPVAYLKRPSSGEILHNQNVLHHPMLGWASISTLFTSIGCAEIAYDDPRVEEAVSVVRRFLEHEMVGDWESWVEHLYIRDYPDLNLHPDRIATPSDFLNRIRELPAGWYVRYVVQEAELLPEWSTIPVRPWLDELGRPLDVPLFETYNDVVRVYVDETTEGGSIRTTTYHLVQFSGDWKIIWSQWFSFRG